MNILRRIYKKVTRECRASKIRKGQGSYFVMEINADIGLFAQLNWIVFLLGMCEHRGLDPYISLSSRLYQSNDTHEWFAALFSYRLLNDDDMNKISRISPFLIHELDELGIGKEEYVVDMSIRRAHKLFFKYISISPDIHDYVNDFCLKRFSGEKVLGVHYRGTDKDEEAPRASYNECCSVIDKKIDEFGEISSLFISSDENEFILHAEERYKGSLIVHSHEDMHRSLGGKPTHLDHEVGDNYQKAREALLNCMILSRADYLIKSASFLSAWSCIFNPDLPVELINVPYNSYLWFPDKEIAGRTKEGSVSNPVGQSV